MVLVLSFSTTEVIYIISREITQSFMIVEERSLLFVLSGIIERVSVGLENTSETQTIFYIFIPLTSSTLCPVSSGGNGKITAQRYELDEDWVMIMGTMIVEVLL